MKSTDRLFEISDDARRTLSYEEREGIADALRGDSANEAAVSPRGSRFLQQLTDQLGHIEANAGHEEKAYWANVAANDITEPAEAKTPDQMTDDELEREIERRRKYGLDA